MSPSRFEDFSDAYQAMIDWPKRLAHETPFYRQLFARVGARRVLDAACGTGHHAALFSSWGLEVEGADLSPAMIANCRAQHGESPTLRWVARSFAEPHPQPASFDVAVCAGNSLALAGDMAAAAAAVTAMLSAVRPGGALVIHVPNLWRLADGPALWQKCVRATLPEGDCLIFKGMRRHGSTGYVDLIVARLDAPAPPAAAPMPGERPANGPTVAAARDSASPGIGATPPPAQSPVVSVPMRTECASFLSFEASDLERMLRQAGAQQVELWGGYQQQPYDRANSVDLVIVGIR